VGAGYGYPTDNTVDTHCLRCSLVEYPYPAHPAFTQSYWWYNWHTPSQVQHCGVFIPNLLSLKVTDNTTDTHRLRCSIVGYSYLTCFHSKLLIIQLTRTVSGAALWGIRTQLPLKAASLLLSSHHLQATPHKSCTVCMLWPGGEWGYWILANWSDQWFAFCHLIL
jgi:hypothetical protein